MPIVKKSIILEKENGDLWSHIGVTPGQKGVCFLIRKNVKHMIENIIGVSER